MEKLKAILDINGNYILICLLFVFYTMEQLLNTSFKFKNRSQHLFQNLLFQATFVVANYFFAMLLVLCVGWLNENRVGLLYLVQIPYWLKLILSVALVDMTTYWFHRMAHRIPLLWRLHRIHHSDTSVDASTALRAHPIEVLVFGTSNIVAAGLFGLDFIGLGLYFLIVIPVFLLQHTNVQFPRWIDTAFGWIFVTPGYHKVHHEQNQYYTDSNYADIFVWDRLFGTYRSKPLNEIVYGLKEFDNDKMQSFLFQMKSPFINIKRITPENLLKNDSQDHNL